MTKLYAIGALALAGLLWATGAAGQWGFLPRAAVGFMDYELTNPPIELSGGVLAPEQKFATTVKLISVGGTVFEEQIYFDAYIQTTEDGDDSYDIPAVSFSEKFEGDRDDFSLAVGYAFNPTVSIYLGYKTGETSTSSNAGSTAKLEESGYFAGGSYGWVIENRGVVSFNLALANLDGDIKTRFPALPEASIDAVSEATGLSYGLSWRAPLADRIGYAVSLDIYAYDFEDIIDKSQGALPGEVEEDVVALKFALNFEVK